jgi:predicted amidohydrolase YtcJ
MPPVLFTNARVLTMDPGLPEAEAVAIDGGRILAVGSTSDVRAQVSGTEHDLRGAALLPGFYDSHNHMLMTGLNLAAVDLSAATTIADVLDAVAQRAAVTPSGTWVMSSARWHESQLVEARFPMRQELDRAAPDHPVLVPRGGHNVVANSRALDVAGIASDQPNPPGGTFVRTAEGDLTGHAIGAAAQLIRSRVPPPPEQVLHQALERIEHAYNEAGITSVIDPGLGLREIAAYRSLPNPTVHASLMWRLNPGFTDTELHTSLEMLRSGQLRPALDHPWARILAIKLGVDGGVEAGYYREPYAFADDPGSPRGKPYMSVENLRAFCAEAARLNWQVGAHCVGDAAIDLTLDAFDTANAAASILGRRWTLIHMMQAREDHWTRANQLGLVVTAQQPLLYTLADGFLKYIGPERTRDIEPLQMYLSRSEQPVGGGSDSPVTPFQPLLGIWSSVTRQTHSAGVQGQNWRIGVMDALRMYTAGSAYAAFEEDAKGSITPGKHADLVVLSEDPRKADANPDVLREIQVIETYVDGRLVYSRAE